MNGKREAGAPPQSRQADEPAATPGAVPKLFCDAMLGRLSRDLRMLGVDVEYKRGRSGMRFYQQARSNGRTFLTRNSRLRELPGVLYVDSEVPDEQMVQVKEHFGIGSKPRPEPEFKRCLLCNVSLERINREQARPSIPFFIYQIHSDFHRCPKCKRVYWPGSHQQDMARRVSIHRPGRRIDPRRAGRPDLGGQSNRPSPGRETRFRGRRRRIDRHPEPESGRRVEKPDSGGRSRS